MILSSRVILYRISLFGALLLLLSIFAPFARADGGAPQLAYVAGAAQGIGVIDIAQRRLTGTISLDGDPHMVLLSPDGQFLYVAQPTAGHVSVITAKTGKARCSASLPGQPSLLALSLDANVLYVAGQGDTSVRAIDPTNCAIRQSFQTNEPVYGLAVAASTAANATPSTPNQLWISGTTQLTVFEATGRLLGTVPVAGGPQNISIPGGFTAYVTTRQGSVVAFDLNTRKLIRTLLSGGQYGHMDFDETTGEVYVPDQRHNQLDVLAPITLGTVVMPREPARVLSLSGSPQSVAITNDGQLGFAALSNGRVVMLDIPGRTVITTVTVGGTPNFIITGLYPPANGSTTVPQQTVTPPQAASPGSAFWLIVLLIVAGILLICTLWVLWRYFQQRSPKQRSVDKQLK